MIFALLPVKAPGNAKQRLSGWLSAAQREALARAMFEHVLETLCAARGLDQIAVATSDEIAAERARRAGALVFREREQISHSHSADAAAQRAAQLGARTVIMVPIDAPLVTPAEVEALVTGADVPLAIVPSADGTGTNALVRTPPDVIESRFGKNSFRAHVEQAQAKGIEIRVLRPPGLVFDLDTPDDAAELLARAPDCRTASLLRAQLGSRWMFGS